MKYLIFFLFAYSTALGQKPTETRLCNTDRIDSLILVSRAFTDRNEFDKALEISILVEKEALEKCGKISAAYASGCFNHGRILYNNGYYEASKPWYLEAKAIREQVLGKNHVDYGKSLNNLAIVYDLLHEFEKSVPMYQEALVLREKLFGRQSEEYADVLSNLATAYMEMGLYEKSEKLTIEALNIRKDVLDIIHPDYAASLQNLANLYFEMGDYERSAVYYQQSNDFQESSYGPDPELIAKGFDNLANAHVELAAYQQAEMLYLKALAIRDTVMRPDHPDYLKNLHDLAYLYSRKGDSDKAWTIFDRMDQMKDQIMAADISLWALTLHNKGNLYLYLKQPEKAEQHLLESKALYEKIGLIENKWYITNLESLALSYQQKGDRTKAHERFNTSSDLYKNLIIKASSYQSIAQLDKFIQLFKGSMGYHNEFAQQAPEAAALCYDDALFHKGFLLQAAIQLQKAAQKDPVSAEQFNLYKSYQRRLAIELANSKTERTEADSLIAHINELEKILAGTNLDFGTAMRQAQWQQVKAALKPGEASIEFVHYEMGKDTARKTQYAALLLTADAELPIFVPLFEEQHLAKLFGNLRSMSLFHYVKYLYQGQKLYNLCWKPLASALNNTIHTIYYAPSGMLHRLNLTAINLPYTEHTTSTTILGEKYRMIQLGSTRQLIPALRSPDTNIADNMALFGAIKYDLDTIQSANNRFERLFASRGDDVFSVPDSTLRMEKWKDLKGTEIEIQSIQSIANQGNTPVVAFAGHQATEEAVKQLSGQAPKVLHVATHGFFYAAKSVKLNDKSGAAFKSGNQPLMRSGLIMAGGNYAWNKGKPFRPDMEDGILTAYEVSQMDLNGTEVVVLSACETALGDVAGHEGVFGLQRAFKIAGAKQLIMSLWKVSDKETQELMSSFYQHWFIQKQSAAEAFRSAQAEIRASYPNPYYWAGFVLIE
jgi:CHAT domain-containing protein